MARNSDVAPPHWPKHIQYTQRYIFHSSVSLETKRFIETGPKSTLVQPGSKWTVIRHISDPSHPAFNQFGLFAAKKIPAKAHILDYIGQVHTDERLESDYDLSLHRFLSGESVGIDASRIGNEARFINDYRGIRGKANAVFIDYRNENGELRMGIFASGDDIKKGEELVVSYGKGFWKARSLDAQ
ncbi:hypothetical protein GYMLUDRAFT_33487 [Collybiopsis luxurians FD-317 M1]|nr:hypothetical protein GYMLUDRAFT_33487 [Collybiopsis luxurians FD-317 M1]